MPEELVFTVAGSKASPATPITLGEAGLSERQHLQEWVLEYPQILGEKVRPVAFEFDQWTDQSGNRDLHRLDVLALDRDGFLVVAELKRGRAEGLTDLQAVQYAAMASRFTVDRLAEHHAAFLTRTMAEEHTKDDALDALLEWAPDLSDETLKSPRIMLVASDFARNVSNTVVFLNDVGLSASLVRFQSYRTPSGEVVVTFSRLYPVPEVDDFTVVPRGLEQRQRQQDLSRRRKPTVTRLFDAGAINPGEAFCFDPDFASDEGMREQLRRWLDENPDGAQATWQDQRSAPLVWKLDGQPYAPTPLALRIIAAATGKELAATRGPRWWKDQHGRSLVDIANAAEADGGF